MLMGIATALLAGIVSPTSAEWTQWRGPNRDAAAPAGSAWAKAPAELTRRWRAEVGSGQSSPVVSGRAAFLFTREKDRETARALDLESGRVLWQQGYAAPYDVYPGAASYGAGPRSTPVIHDGRLFTLGISGILTAFDSGSGRILWQKDFAGRFPAAAPPFGTSMSPLIAGGLLIVHAGGHDGGALIAFDPASGAEKWTLPGEGPSYSSPILTTLLGQEQLVIQVHRKVLGVDPGTGRELWSIPFVTPCDQNIVTPLQVGDRLVLSSLDKGTMAVELRKNGDKWTAQTVWHNTDVPMYMSSPVNADGRVVGLSHKRKGQFFALDAATGAVQWTSPGGQGENAALVVAGDSLLVLQGDGTLLALPRGAASFEPTRRYRVAESATYAYPVPTGHGLLIKDENAVALYVPVASAKADARPAAAARPDR
jgi:outer membrane protein assembly factor BamB